MHGATRSNTRDRESEDDDDSGDFDCSICLELLLDPVVAACCGNDFCKHCYELWVEQKRGTNANARVQCPVCRQPLPSTTPGICKRIARQIEAQYADRLQQRRLEVKAHAAQRESEKEREREAALQRGWERAQRATGTSGSSDLQELFNHVTRFTRNELRTAATRLQERTTAALRGASGFPSVASVAGTPPIGSLPAAYQQQLDAMGLRPDNYAEPSLPPIVVQPRSAVRLNPPRPQPTVSEPSDSATFSTSASDRASHTPEHLRPVGLRPFGPYIQDPLADSTVTPYRPAAGQLRENMMYQEEDLGPQELQYHQRLLHQPAPVSPVAQRQASMLSGSSTHPSWPPGSEMITQTPPTHQNELGAGSAQHLNSGAPGSLPALPDPSQLHFTMGAYEQAVRPPCLTRRRRQHRTMLRRAHPVMRRRVPGAHVR